MSVHEQFVEDLALHALGSLQGTEKHDLEQHLDRCPACHREFMALQNDAALLAFAAAGRVPPPRVRQRLLHAIAQERRTSVVTPRRSWTMAFAYSLAAAVALVAVFFWNENQNLRRALAEVERHSSAQQNQFAQARDLVNTLTSPEAQRINLVAAKSPPQPQGKAFYRAANAHLVFVASNLMALPPDKVYELWLIPLKGSPIPAGLFKADSHGSAAVVGPPLPSGVEAKAFAITIEPEGGSSAPTSAPILVGAGE